MGFCLLLKRSIYGIKKRIKMTVNPVISYTNDLSKFPVCGNSIVTGKCKNHMSINRKYAVRRILFFSINCFL